MVRRFTHWPSVALSGALVLLFAIAAVATAAGPTPDPQLLSLFKTPNTEFPAVAMRVGGRPVSGQYLAYAVKQFQDSAASAGQTLTRPQAVQAVIDRLASTAAIAAEATKRGYTASDQEITAYLTAQTNGMVAEYPAVAAAVWAANGDGDAAAYINDPNVRAMTAGMLAGAKMLTAMHDADPGFDYRAFVEQLKASVSVELLFTP